MARSHRKTTAARISISLPVTLYDELDAMVTKRGYASRSDAISKMISEQLVQHQHDLGKGVLAGTITLIYDHAKAGLTTRLLNIQHRWLKEIISAQRVHLENHHTLEVLLVQGPGCRLKEIARALLSCKGVKHGYLTVTSTILPPIH